MLNKKTNIATVLAFAIGFNALLFQILMTRQLLQLFNGNEFVIGVLLFLWLCFTSIGLFLGKLHPKITTINSIKKHFLIYYPLLALLVFITQNYASCYSTLPGMQLGFVHLITFAIMIILPLCVYSGYLFSVLTITAVNEQKIKSIVTLYAVESLGGAISGILFSFFIVRFLLIIESLIITVFFNLVVYTIIAIYEKNRIQVVVSFIIMAILSFFYTFSLDFLFIKEKYPHENIELIKNSPYGIIVVTQNKNQWNIYQNNKPVYFDSDNIEAEEKVHYGMVQLDSVKNILIIGGSIKNLLPEILKYDVENIHYILQDKALLKLQQDLFFIPANKRLYLFNTDAYSFIFNTKSSYSFILQSIEEPNTIAINRFYTCEYFLQIKKLLNTGGVFSFALPSTVNYLSKEQEALQGSIVAAIKKVFKHFIVIQGNQNYYICSDKPLDYQIAKRIEQSRIENNYVNKYYLDDEQIKTKGTKLLEKINQVQEANNINKPIALNLQQLVWFDKFSGSYLYFLPILIILLLIFTFIYNNNNRLLFIVGYAVSGTEILIIITFQLIFGSIFEYLSLLLSLFMLGLFISTFYLQKFFNKVKSLYYLAFLGVILLLNLFVILIVKNGFTLFSLSSLILFLHCLLTLLLGVASGTLFAFVNRNLQSMNTKQSIINYSSDLLGASLGFLLTSGLLIPLWGIVSVSIIHIIAILSGVFLIIYNKNKLNSEF